MSSNADPQTQRVQSRVARVTLYEASAQVQREVVVSLEAGLTRLLFEGLPAGINERTLQVALDEAGGRGVVLKGCSFETHTVPNPALSALTSKREQAVAAVKRLEAEIVSAKDDIAAAKAGGGLQERCFAKAMAPAARESDRGVDVGHLASLVEAAAGAFQGARAELRGLEDTLEALEAELAAATIEAGAAIPYVVSQRLVTVMLETNAPVVKLGVVLTYQVANAGWRATYEVRVNSSTRKVALGYNAEVHQTTGETWTDVEVALSTARPNVSGRQPELEPWRINIHRDFSGRSFSKGNKKSKSSHTFGGGDYRGICADDEDDGLEGCVTDADAIRVEEAAVKEGTTAVSFEIAGVHTIESTSEAARMPIGAPSFGCEISYVCVPKVVACAYAVATVTNTSGFVLMPGPTTVFLDGQYVCASAMERVAPTEAFKINVGRDEGVSVEHRLVTKERADAGNMFSGRKNAVTYRYATKIRNGKPLPVSITVRQQVPVGDTDEIAVALVEPKQLSAEQERQRAEEGLIEQTVVLRDGQTTDLPLVFQITYTKDETLYGM